MSLKVIKQKFFNQKVINAGKYSLFWSWNLIFGLLIGFVLFEHMIIPVVSGTLIGSVPLDQGIFALALIVVPLVCVTLGLTKSYRPQPDRLLQLFYGIEIPLFFLFLIRLTLLRELHAGTLHLLIVFLLGMSAFAWYMFNGTRKLNRWQSMVSLTALSFTLLAGVYVALLLLLFTVPLTTMALKGFFSFGWLVIFKGNFLALLIGVFAAYTATLFIGLPVMMSYLYSRAFLRQFTAVSRSLGMRFTATLVGGVLLANLAVFQFANVQHQEQAIALLEQPIDSEQDRKRLLAQSALIRDGLLNAYLATYRYTSAAQTVNLLQELYADAFALKRNGFPEVAQAVFNYVAKPFLYQGGFSFENREKVAQYFSEFFDAPIEKAERRAIQQAIKANWNREGMAAGLIDKDREKVRITRQRITVQEHAQWAVITLDESYENQTFEPQEIIYHFSLPQEAAVTGIWLSEEAANPTMHPYSVAPRGAAQKVYRQELQQRQDPALLEQVGPRQYRLRAFPIPPRRTEHRRSLDVNVQQLHLRLQYVAPLNKSRRWPLPQLLEKRNVFWKNSSQWQINGKAYNRIGDRWLPSGIDAQNATLLSQQHVYFDTPNDAYWVEINPLDEPPAASSPQISPKNYPKNYPQTYAVLIDTSYSMHLHKQVLNDAINKLRKLAANSNIEVEFFQTGASPQRLAITFAPEDLVFFGNTGQLSQLQQWHDMTNPNLNNSRYSAVFLLSDEGSYEIKDDIEATVPPLQPIWLVHLQGVLPYAYDDRLMELLNKSDGGSATSFNNALQRAQWRQSHISGDNKLITDDYQWTFTPVNEFDCIDSTKTASVLNQLMARQWINMGHRIYHQGELKTLDQLHASATKYSLVSPFSSMIVLVNDRQKQDLEKFSGEQDRYERVIESGAKNVSTPMDLLTVKGVPEPEEWALIIVVAIMLTAAYIRKHRLGYAS